MTSKTTDHRFSIDVPCHGTFTFDVSEFRATAHMTRAELVSAVHSVYEGEYQGDWIVAIEHMPTIHLRAITADARYATDGARSALVDADAVAPTERGELQRKIRRAVDALNNFMRCGHDGLARAELKRIELLEAALAELG